MLRRKVLSLAAVLASAVSSGVAVAQEATMPPPTPPPAPDVVVGEAPEPAPPGEKTEEIVVTGTRIRRKDLTTPAPVTVINRDQIQASGKVSIGDFLQALPEQGNAINTGVNNGGDGATRINLRGIGAARTLVLVNGRRWMPGGTGANSSVDLNSIPTAAVERIEVLKDGASAVYGSDAIAGVVNIITRHAGTQSDASAYAGTSYKGDGTAYDLNVTTSTGGDRGNLLFSIGYFDQRKTMADDRGFSAIPYGFDGTTGAPYTAGSGTIPAGRTLAAGAVGAGNQLWSDLTGTGEGSFIWTDATAPDPANGVFCGTSPSGRTECFRPYLGAGLREAGEVGDGYNFQPDNYLITPQQRLQLFATGDLNLGGVARAYVEAAYVNRQSAQDLAPEPLVLDGEGVLVSAANLYNPFGADVYVRRRLSEFGRRQTRQDIDSFRVVTGVDGTLPERLGPLEGWFWDVNFNYGRTTGMQTNRGNLFLSALADALGPSMLVGGAPTCVRVANDSTTAIPGCVPLNLFGGPNSITPDQVTGLTFTGVARGTNELTSFQVNTSGELIPLLADRPVGLAAGYEFRRLAGEFIFDPITEKGLVTGNKGQNTQGSYDVNELYAELSVPIVSGLRFAEDVEATAAIRWFDYSTFGSDYTYKFGGRWRPIRDVTVRGTYSTAFRAPSISDLFQGRADNFAGLRDPCRGPGVPGAPGEPLTPGTPLGDRCLAQGVPAGGSGDESTQLRSIIGGNPALQPETADIFTVGLVFQPRWVKDLSVTLDYYDMSIDQNISSIGESVILAGCYSGRNPDYCALVNRDPGTHFIDNILNLNENVGSLSTAGIDLAIRYAVPTPSFGRFGLALDGAWLRKIDQVLADGTVVEGRNTFDLWSLNSAGGSGGTFPEWKFNAAVTWGLGGLGAGLSTRYLGSFTECGDDTGDFSGAGLCYADRTYQRKVASYHAEDVFVSYGFGNRLGKTNLMAGVLNVGNAPPARIYNGFISQTDAYNYDVMGRFFYVRLAQTY